MYLTYEEYQSMGGTLDSVTFQNYEFEAEAAVNWYTFNRLSNDLIIPDAVKRVVKYLIDIIRHQDDALSMSEDGQNDSSIIASQSNDGVSVSYAVLSAAERMKALKDSEKTTIDRFLQGVTNEAGRRLLYKGLYPGE